MIPFLPMAIGAGLGALASKKPLKGALLGAGLGAAGGLLGGAGAATGAAGGAAGGTGLLAGGGTGLSAGGGMGLSGSLPMSAGLSTAANGTVGQVAAGTSGGLLAQAQPWMSAAGTGMQMANQFQPEQQPITPAQIQQGGSGSQQLEAISQSLEQNKLNDAQMQQMKREMQQKLIGQIGGRYGLIG